MKALDPTRLLAISHKEVRHIVRDPFTLGMALGLPLVLLMFFGYAMDLDMRQIHLSVFDRDQSRSSRELTAAFSGSGFFRVTPGSGPVTGDLDADRAKVALIIEGGFSRDLKGGKGARVQVLLDGSDNSTAGVIASYLGGIGQTASRRLVPGGAAALPVDLRTRFLFNPELNSRWFIVPGLMVVIIGLLSTLLTALTVAREWENGSMELLLSTPVKPLEILAGKLLPYLGLGLIGVTVVYLAARLLFGVPFLGNHLLLLAGCLLFLGPCLSQGLLISTATRQQQAAFQFSMMTALLPAMLLSGFIFPVESMPRFFYYFTSILPARWFIVVVRSLFLKGTDPLALALPFGVLAVMNVLLITLTLKAFKTDVEP